MLDVIAIGDCVVDLIIKIPSLPVKNEDVITTESFTRQGGGMCNFLIMAARLGLKAGVIDRLGDDYHGKFISEIFKKEGIDVSHLHFAQGENTTQVFVLVDDKGQHAFIGVLGSGMKLSEQDIADDYIKQSRCLYTCGYTLFSNKTPHIMSLLVIIPMGLSLSVTMSAPIPSLIILIAASLMLVFLSIYLISGVMMSYAFISMNSSNIIHLAHSDFRCYLSVVYTYKYNMTAANQYFTISSCRPTIIIVFLTIT